MPSNTLALGLYERCILKRTFRHTTGFCRFREGERRRLSIGDNFLQQLRRSGVSRVCGEKVAAARTEKLGTHTHTHSHTHTLTHTHTGRLLYPRYSPAAARVMTTKVLSSRRPRSSAARPMKLKICKQLLIKDRKKDRRRTKRDSSLYYKETNN